jgi:hypothetical protein
MKATCLQTLRLSAAILSACGQAAEPASEEATTQSGGGAAPMQSPMATVTAGSAGAAGRMATPGMRAVSNGGAAAAAGSGNSAGAGAGAAGNAGGSATAAAGSGVAPAAGSGGAPSAGAELVWPNADSSANSDPWLAQNHDKITQLRPRVLVIDLENTDEVRAKKLIDQHIASLKEASSFHKYKEPAAEPAVVYELVKIAQAPKGGARIDYNSWNTQSFADSALQLKDPKDPDGPNLTLCGLFEQGVINEVWCMASSDPKCGETQEYKQVYEMDGQKVAGSFRTVSNGDDISGLGCKVSARITDFNSGRGAGCHQHALGHAWERYMDGNAVPQLGKQAKRFLNWDLDTRVSAPFSNFYSACRSNGTQLTDCIEWSSQINAKSGPSASRAFDLADMSEGCGNAHFYANTTGTYSYDANMPDPEVLTSCENYGMHNGEGGKDLTTTYTNAMTDKLYGRSMRDCPADQPACDDDCGGHGTTHLYQNFPGPGTQAKNDDGTPMQNWWVYLFY